jgi:hypothetical protein
VTFHYICIECTCIYINVPGLSFPRRVVVAGIEVTSQYGVVASWIVKSGIPAFSITRVTCICMYVCVYVRMYLSVHACMYTCFFRVQAPVAVVHCDANVFMHMFHRQQVVCVCKVQQYSCRARM